MSVSIIINNDEVITEIITFPALFMTEAEEYCAKAGAEQQAFFGFFDSVRPLNDGIKIRRQLLWPIPMQQISDIGVKLSMKDMTKAISEMNHSHWV